MIYLDNGATSFYKPPQVRQAVLNAMTRCANPGRGGYPAAMAAAEQVYLCRETAAALFSCQPEQVALTYNCTHGLNIAIRTLVKPGDPVVISGFEHNAATRTLHALGARTLIAGRRLFDWTDTLEQFEKALQTKPSAAVFTHVSNVFGFILPVQEIWRAVHFGCSPVCWEHGSGSKQTGCGFYRYAGAQGASWPTGDRITAVRKKTGAVALWRHRQ